MDELANTENTSLSTLDKLGEQARMYSEAVMMNLFQLGRVLIEAKSLCQRGEWGNWLKQHTDMSDRSAQNIMGIYRRFGNRPAFAEIDKAKLFSMLALPEGKEEQFVSENNVADMTSREVAAAVKQAREEARAEIDRANQARLDAERRAEEAESRPPELPDDVAETLRTQKQQIEQLQAVGRDAIEESTRLQRENARIQQELQEQGELLEETQEQYNRAQAELLNAQSAIARGDAERTPASELTLEAFESAVRSFIGAVARMPHMHRAFSAMDGDTREEYNQLLSTVESWAKGAREALDTFSGEGSYIHGM